VELGVTLITFVATKPCSSILKKAPIKTIKYFVKKD